MTTGYFFDLDGTLYNNQTHSVSARAIEALSLLQKRGNRVFVASSRTLRELDHAPAALRNFPFDGKILDGGSRILDAKGQPLVVKEIPSFLMTKIDKFCKMHQLIYRYSTPTGNYWGTPADMAAHQIYFDLYLCSPVYKPLENDVVLNVLIFCDSCQQEKIVAMTQGCGVVCFDHAIEIRAENIDKIWGIQWCKQHFDLSELICFGDGQNDIEMLKGADLGLCMGNGHPALKQVADQVIGRIDQDGIYHFLKDSQRI